MVIPEYPRGVKSVIEIGVLLCSFTFFCCSTDDNQIWEEPICFEVNGSFQYKSSIAIDTTTFKNFIGNYKLRIPFCETTNSGNIIVGADIRENTTNDQTQISIGVVRSTDGGISFNEPQIIIPHTEESEWDRAMDGTILIDRTSGRIFVFAHRITSKDVWEHIHRKADYPFDCVFVFSDDDGVTWSKPQSFRANLDIDESNIVSVFGGVGHGITMSNGILVLPIQCKMAYEDDNTAYNIQSGIAYSYDGGRTWKCESLIPCYSSECMAIEYAPGKLMINCKSYIGKRRVFVTSDLGKTWMPHFTDEILIEPRACQGSLHKISKWGFFLNPLNEKMRSNITLQITEDFIKWIPKLEIYSDQCFGYTCLCNSGNNIYAVSETLGGTIKFYKIFQE